LLRPKNDQVYKGELARVATWTALGSPDSPPSARKTLRVIPFLTKDMSLEHFEYLADKKTQPSGAITQVYIAELLA